MPTDNALPPRASVSPKAALSALRSDSSPRAIGFDGSVPSRSASPASVNAAAPPWRTAAYTP